MTFNLLHFQLSDTVVSGLYGHYNALKFRLNLRLTDRFLLLCDINVKGSTILNIVFRAIKSYVKNCEYHFC
jgi:hypothetical protein